MTTTPSSSPTVRDSFSLIGFLSEVSPNTRLPVLAFRSEEAAKRNAGQEHAVRGRQGRDEEK